MNNLTNTRFGNSSSTDTKPLISFVRRVSIVIGLVALAGILIGFFFYGLNVLLLAFSGVLFAIFIRSLSTILYERTPLSEQWSVSIVLLLLVAIIVISGLFMVPRIGSQVEQLNVTFPQSMQQVKQTLDQYGLGNLVQQQWFQPSQFLPQQSNIASRIAGIFSTTLGAVTSIIVILFTGLFLAYEPRTYIDGFVKLVPTKARPRTRQILKAIGFTLRWWLAARFLSMVVIAVLTFFGLWFLGVPMALTLSILTGLLTFIPIVGATLAIVLPMLVAFTQGPMLALYVLGFYLLLQTVESYLITPLVQEKAISLPSALMILFQLFFGAVAGILGIALATPVLATIIVVTKLVYIEDILNDTVQVKGLQPEASS